MGREGIFVVIVTLVAGVTSACARPHAETSLPSAQAACPAGDYRVRFETTKGAFVVEVHEAWAPNGAGRFQELVRSRYLDGLAFYRVIDGFMAQAGIHGNPQMSAIWAARRLPDDPPGRSNRGTVAMARSGEPDSATAQWFVNTRDNFHLDAHGYSPFGCVASGMHTVDSLYSGYGEGRPSGAGPDQRRLMQEGEAYLADFPLLDRIIRAEIKAR